MRALGKLLLILLVIPLVIVLAMRHPQGAAHLVEVIFTVGARMLDATVTFLDRLLSGH